MKVEIYTELETRTFNIKGELAKWIKAHLDNGKEFEIFFPDYEIK